VASRSPLHFLSHTSDAMDPHNVGTYVTMLPTQEWTVPPRAQSYSIPAHALKSALRALSDELYLFPLIVLQVYIMLKFQGDRITIGVKRILRDNTPPDTTEIRWDVSKSMLDDFPQLRDRAEQYILEKKNPTQPSSTGDTGQTVKELLQKAIHLYRQERSSK